MVKQKRMNIRTGLRTASKVQENQLIGAGKWLAEHPDAIIPKSEEENRGCNFSKIASKIYSVSEKKDDLPFLRRMAKRGDQLVRAYAASILLTAENLAPYLAVARGTEGNIAYGYSPKVRREPLIGLQYFKDPHLRLFAYAHLSRKKKLIFYSTKDAVYCSTERGKPPSKFIDETSARLNLSRKDKSNFSCGHNLDEQGYLLIEFKSANISMMICEKCFGDDKSAIVKTVERVIAPKIQNIFNIMAFVRLECRSKCEDCPTGNMYDFEVDDLDEYVTGRISDRKMYELAVEGYLDTMKESEKKILVIGKKCFGNDKSAFAEALAISQSERDTLLLLLSKLEGSVVVPGNMTTNKFLAQYWEKYGSYLMSELAGARKEEEPPKLSDNMTPMMLIEKAKSHQRATMIKDALPRYKSLGKHSSFVDTITRTYKSKGSEAALRLTTPAGTEDTHQKSIGLAFRIALGETGIEWQYTREEIDLAKHLAASARTLLEAEGDEYDVLLRHLIKNAGIQDDIVRMK